MGFLLAGVMISMWVSNTATAMMMLPIALSVASLTPKRTGQEPDSFSPALMLAVAYGATAGGTSDLIGTPPNALLAGYLDRVHGFQIGFAQWMLIGVPVVLVTLPVIYWTLTRWVFRLPEQELPGMHNLLEKARKGQGPISRGEWAVGGVLALDSHRLDVPTSADPMDPHDLRHHHCHDGCPGALFMIPVCRKKRVRHGLGSHQNLTMGVLLLFGGGLSLAGMIQKQGVSQYLGQWAGPHERMAHMDAGGRHLPGYSSFDRIDQQYRNSRHFLAHHWCHCRKPRRKPLTASYSNGTRRQLLFHDAGRHPAQRHRLCQWATDFASDGQGRLAPQSPARSISGGSSPAFGPLGLRNPDRSAPRLGGPCDASRGRGHRRMRRQQERQEG